MNRFKLYETVRELIQRIHSDLVEPTRDRISVLKAERDAAVVSAGHAFSAVEATCRNRTSTARAVAEKSVSSAKEASINIHRAMAIAREHLDANKLPGVDIYPASIAPFAGKGAHDATKNLGDTALALSARQRPRYVPATNEGRWPVAIGSLLLAFWFVPFALLWPASVLVRQFFWEAESRDQAGRILERSHALLMHWDEVRVKAEQRLRAEGEFVEKTLREARRTLHVAEAAADQQWAEGFAQLRERTKHVISMLQRDTDSVWKFAGIDVASWEAVEWKDWKSVDLTDFVGRIGQFELQLGDVATVFPALEFRLPALVPFDDGKCLLLNASGANLQKAVGALQSTLLRVLATSSPGKARFIFIDPIGLGQNASDFIPLANHDKELIAGKVWTESRHIQERLSELTEHIETVIQKYLRRDYPSIREFNEDAKEVAEPYRFLVVFDFPAGFSGESARKLISIIRNGPRCGVFTLIVRDSSKKLPYDFDLVELESAAHVIDWSGAAPVWRDAVLGTYASLAVDSIDSATGLASKFVETIGTEARSLRVEVPFERIRKLAGITDDCLWQGVTAQGLQAPLGPSGARRLEYLRLGETAHHGLIVGRTGSGKTNLMHVIIAGLVLTYSPEELQLFLIDFKGGVGFKPYAASKLPHARVIAIDSDREFGLSVLEGFDRTLRERFELFRKTSVDNIADYRAAPRSLPMPRILLIVDEYQELFAEEDLLAQQARGILDRIAKQGRAFGIHMLMGSQSLVGNGQLQTSTMGQMSVRIALACQDADARLIFSDDNLAARSLSRRGEAIYNGLAGLVEGNSPFQVALLGDEQLQAVLRRVRSIERDTALGEPIVFEGSEPAVLENAGPIRAFIAAGTWDSAAFPSVWLGEPIAMRSAVSASLDMSPGRHLLIVERDGAQGTGVLHAGLISLLLQHRPTMARFLVIDAARTEITGDSPLSTYGSAFDHEIELVRPRDFPRAMAELVGLITERENADASQATSPVFVIIQGLQGLRDLRSDAVVAFDRHDKSQTASDMFEKVLRDGPDNRVHVLAWCDTLSNAKRAAGRSASEFGLRVAGTMSDDDSRQFIDGPEAARLSKPCRMIFADESRPNSVQAFRPFASPSLEWVKELASLQRSWRVREVL